MVLAKYQTNMEDLEDENIDEMSYVTTNNNFYIQTANCVEVNLCASVMVGKYPNAWGAKSCSIGMEYPTFQIHAFSI